MSDSELSAETALSFRCSVCGSSACKVYKTLLCTSTPSMRVSKEYVKCDACDKHFVIILTRRRESPWRIVSEFEIRRE
jgi:hypothetical protein